MDRQQIALRVAWLKVLKEYIEEQYSVARSEAAKVLDRGERLVARSPVDGQKIAAIPKSDPKPVAQIVDEPALSAWMAEHYPDTIIGGYEIAGSQKEVIDVLFTHAPHLLRRVKKVNADALNEVKWASAALGQPVGPGGEVDVPGVEVRIPPSVVSCTPAEGALAIVRSLHDQGVLQLDGHIAPAVAAVGE